jgi:putative transposase
MLKLIPRHHFAKLETEHGTGRKARSFTRWSQLVHLLSMQLTARASLRDGVASLKARIKNLYHLGVKPVARSTFADANSQRPASFFEALFGLIYQRCQPLAPKHKFRFKNKLFSLDATVVSLCLTLFPWASFRRTKGGVKLHTLFDHAGYLPAFVAISPAREHEIRKARSLSLPKGSIVMADLGYTDYHWYTQLTAQKIFFVTRQKRNARYEVLERRKVNKKQGLLSGQTIRLTGDKAKECPGLLRRIAYLDATTGRR